MEIHFYGIYPSVGIFSFSRENFRESVPDCVVLVVVDMGFAGGGTGLAGGCDGGTVVEGAKIDVVVIDTTEGTMVTRGVTGGNGLVTGTLGWEVEGGNGVLCLGGEGSDTGLMVY